MSATFSEAVELQSKIMLKIANRLDERGYAVIAHQLNSDARPRCVRRNYHYCSKWERGSACRCGKASATGRRR